MFISGVTMKRRLLFLICLFMIFLITGCKEKGQPVIETREDLLIAINQANDGDTILVGDIDFRGEPKLHKSIFRITLSKSLTFKSAYDRKAVFTSGSFNLEGTKVIDEALSVNFIDISFDGDINGKQITDSSWEYEDPNDIEPRMCQYAMLYKGNVNASYKGCEFKNFMNENGGAFFGLYGDYMGSEFIILNYGDNCQCKLSIDIDDCLFKDNYAYYGGGAIYLEGNKENVDLNIKNSKFIGNVTSCMEFAQGGGAIFVSDCISSFNNCEFLENNGSYSYGLTKKDTVDLEGVPEEIIEDYLSSINDQTSGGAIRTNLGSCEIINSKIISNKASLGGGLASYNSKIYIDGVSFNENTAMCDLLIDENYQTGPWSSMGLGGAVYINSSDGKMNEFYNTSFYKNTARNGYGSIYSYYNGANDGGILVYPIVNIYFSSFMDNKEIISYSKDLTEWSARPGNGYEIPHIKYIGCIIQDDLSYDYFNKYEIPSESNDYSYYASKEKMKEDNVTLNQDLQTYQIKATSNGEISLTVPTDFIRDLQLNNKISASSKLKIGSNYSAKLYKESKNINIPLTISIIVLTLSFICILSFVILVIKRKTNIKETVNTIELESVSVAQVPPSNDEIIEKIENEFKITSREKDVLKLLLQGMKRSEIAETLFLSESAIKKYTASLYSKIGVHSKLELIMKYQNK